MKSNSTYSLLKYFFLMIAALALLPLSAEAQRLQRGGGGSARPAASRPAPSRPAPSKTAPSRPAPSKTAPSRPSPSSKSSINGGSKTAGNRNVNPSSGAKDKAAGAKNNISNNSEGAKGKIENSDVGNKTNIGNNSNIGNKVDINTGDKNVNINVDNSKDIKINNNRTNVVRRSPAPYRRPPYSYGGFHFYCHFGYSYHPFRPFYWGPAWHPWGFFITTLTATAIIVSANNQPYHYDQGVFYEEANGGYTAVEAPNGAVVSDIPDGAEEVTIEQNVTNNYYYGGTYYEEGSEGYTVVPPTAGSVVENLPEGAEEVKVGEVTYVKYGDTYYQPVQVEGDDMYEVAQVEAIEE